MYSFIKRLFDIFLSLILFLILIPLLTIFMILIKFDSKGPFIYKHKRLGKNNKNIYVYKIRTMYNDSDKTLNKMLEDDEIKKEYLDNFKVKNDPRITKLGKILRKYYLDELPQLINVIKGDMSLIGPRPIVEEEKKKYGEKIDKLLSVKPGLTGYWIVNGHNITDYKKRVELELFYVDHQSIILDLKIFIKTIKIILNGKGI